MLYLFLISLISSAHYKMKHIWYRGYKGCGNRNNELKWSKAQLGWNGVKKWKILVHICGHSVTLKLKNYKKYFSSYFKWSSLLLLSAVWHDKRLPTSESFFYMSRKFIYGVIRVKTKNLKTTIILARLQKI